MRSFIEALRVQIRVISALILREIGSRHGSDSVGILWLLVEPILITMIVIGIHWAGSGGAAFVRSIPIVVFLLTGYTPHLMFRHGGLAGTVAWTSNSGLLYHRQVHPVDLVLARILVEIITVLIAFVVVAAIFYVAGQVSVPRYLPYIFLGWFYHIWFTLIVCFFFTGACFIWPLTRRLYQPLVLLALPVYCSFFMLSWIPTNIQWWILLFPPANATEIMRYGYFGASASTFYNIPYTTEVCIILTFFSIVVMFRGRRHLEL
jgi:capsular polysaccharide transport system permease protein